MFSNHVITLCNIWLHMHLQENIKCPWWGIYTYVYLVTLIWDLSIYLSVFPRLDRAFARTVRAIVLSSYWTSTLPDTLPDGIASPRHDAIAFPSNEATSIFNCRPHTRQHLAASGNKDQRSCDAMQKFVAEKKWKTVATCCNSSLWWPAGRRDTTRQSKTSAGACWRGISPNHHGKTSDPHPHLETSAPFRETRENEPEVVHWLSRVVTVSGRCQDVRWVARCHKDGETSLHAIWYNLIQILRFTLGVLTCFVRFWKPSETKHDNIGKQNAKIKSQKVKTETQCVHGTFDSLDPIIINCSRALASCNRTFRAATPALIFQNPLLRGVQKF